MFKIYRLSSRVARGNFTTRPSPNGMTAQPIMASVKVITGASMRVVDLAQAVAPEAEHEIIGIRPGEKLHEELISSHDARRSLDIGSCYVIQPDMEWWSSEASYGGRPVPDEFRYSSDTNTDWLDAEALSKMIQDV